MAGIFYELLLIRQSPHYDFDAPRPRPSTGVLDGEAVKKMVFIQALPALGEMRLLGVAIVVESPAHCQIIEICGINDERVALPVPARSPLVQTNVLRRTRAPIEVNHLRFVRFGANDHDITALNNLEGALLTSRTCPGERRTDPHGPDAPARKRPVFRTCRRIVDPFEGVLLSLPGSGSQWRDSAPPRVGHPRRVGGGRPHLFSKAIPPQRVLCRARFFSPRRRRVGLPPIDG